MEKWYVKFPTWKYEEDVVSLAKEKGLEIVDAKFNGGKVSDGEEFPKLTLKAEEKPKKQPRGKTKKGE